jgi:hypothetical protein
VAFTVVDVLAQAATPPVFAWQSVSSHRVVLAALGALLVTWGFLSATDARGDALEKAARADRLEEVPRRGQSTRNVNPVRASLICAWVCLLCWGIARLQLWPMVSMNDTILILSDPIKASVQHPLVYTLGLSGLVRLGTALAGGNEAVGVVLAAGIQMAAWMAASASVIHVLASAGARSITLGLLIGYLALFPLIADYSFALVKDAVFALFIVAAFPVLWLILRTRGEVLHRVDFAVLTTVVLAGIGTTRNNGLLVVLILAPLVVVLADGQRRRAALVSAVFLLVSLAPVGITRMVAGDQSFTESVGVPLQMLGYAVVNDPDCLPEQVRDYADTVLPLERWVEIYDPETVDAVKYDSSFNGAVIDDDPLGFLRVWGQGALSCPAAFASGFLLHTADLWRFDSQPIAGSGQSMFTEVVSNSPANGEELTADYAARGISTHSLLPESIAKAVRWYLTRGMAMVPGPGWWMWGLVLVASGFTLRHRSGEALAVLSPTVLVWITLMSAAPTVRPFPLHGVRRGRRPDRAGHPVGNAISVAGRGVSVAPRNVRDGRH